MNVFSEQSGDMSRASGETDEDVVSELDDFLKARNGWVSFTEISVNVVGLSGVDEGVIHQVCFDAGFTRVLP